MLISVELTVAGTIPRNNEERAPKGSRDRDRDDSSTYDTSTPQIYPASRTRVQFTQHKPFQSFVTIKRNKQHD